VPALEARSRPVHADTSNVERAARRAGDTALTDPPRSKEPAMGKLGAGITLLVVGAVLTFALHVEIAGVDEHVLGVILMLAGALAVGLWFAADNQRRRTHTVVEDRAPIGDDRVEVADESVPVVSARRRRRLF
jgi:hypothetical protein